MLICLIGRDVVIQAPSQSDRASATAIGVLQNVDPKDEKIQALILTPSRESANRLERLYLNLGQSIDVPCLVCSGGSSVADDLSALESNPPVVIGTPRRIADLIERGALKAGTIRRFALDHADELVSRGHTADIYHIFEKSVFEPRQVVMLSETMPPEVMDMSSELVTNSPACIKVG